MQTQIWTLIHDNLNIQQKEIQFIDEEFHYATHVLRLKVGDKVTITNTKGIKGWGTINLITKKHMSVEVCEIEETKKHLPMVNIWLGCPKPSTLEEVIAFLSEIGIDNIHIIKTEKISFKNVLKMEKLQRISNESTRISKNSFASFLSDFDGLEAFYNAVVMNSQKTRLVLFCDETTNSNDKKENSMSRALQKNYTDNVEEICLLIGPEASFSEKERLFIREVIKPIYVSLGVNILRVPTAAVSSAAVVLDFLRTK